MRNRLTGRLACAAALLVMSPLATRPAGAQQVGVFAVAGASDGEQFRRPVGASVSVAFHPLAWITLRLDGTRVVDEETRARNFCDLYWPQFEGCRDEEGLDPTRAFTGSATLLLLLAEGSRFRLEGGAGITRYSMNNRVTSLESPRSFGQAIHGGATSPVYVLAVATRPFRWQRVGADLEVRHAPTLRFRECWTDSYQPFCGTRTATDVRLGLSYDLSRR